jgi:hypothetical protein
VSVVRIRFHCNLQLFCCCVVGALKKIRIGHDGSGLGAGWFLDKVLVHAGDGTVYYFHSGRWLAVSACCKRCFVVDLRLQSFQFYRPMKMINKLFEKLLSATMIKRIICQRFGTRLLFILPIVVEVCFLYIYNSSTNLKTFNFFSSRNKCKCLFGNVWRKRKIRRDVVG